MSAVSLACVTPEKSESARAALTINAVFFHEIKQEDGDFPVRVRQVQQLLGSVVGRRQPCARVIRHLQNLRDRVHRRFLLEETYGYLTNPRTVDPSCSDQAQRLREEHGHFSEDLNEFLRQAEQEYREPTRPRQWSQILDRVRGWCDRLAVHERCETELIQAHFQQIEFRVSNLQ